MMPAAAAVVAAAGFIHVSVPSHALDYYDIIHDPVDLLLLLPVVVLTPSVHLISLLPPHRRWTTTAVHITTPLTCC
jgi:hypothetical protein